jgi:hypothetical protein
MKRVLVLSIIISLSMCVEENSKHENNPFSVFGVAPWTSWETIHSIYLTKIKEYEKTILSKENFENYTKAYLNIKLKRGIEKDEEKDSSYLNLLKVLSETLEQCFFDIFKLMVSFYIIYYFFVIFDHFLTSMVITIIFKAFCEKMFPHFITSDVRLWASCTLVFIISSLNQNLLNGIKKILNFSDI